MCLFEITVGSHAVVRELLQRYPKYPFPQICPMVTFCKTKGQYYSQDVDVDTVNRQNTSITTWIPHGARL